MICCLQGAQAKRHEHIDDKTNKTVIGPTSLRPEDVDAFMDASDSKKFPFSQYMLPGGLFGHSKHFLLLLEIKPYPSLHCVHSERVSFLSA